MKKHSRLTAVLIAIFMLLASAACSRGENIETTEAETVVTVAPETTEAITEETTEEESTTVVDMTETTAPETLPPKAEEAIRIIMPNGGGEAILSALAEDKYATVLEAREKALLYDHSAEIELSRADDIAKTIQNHILAGDYRYDLLMVDPLTGTALLSAALLENLSDAGISITPTSLGINQSLTESLTLGGVYLFSSTALISDLTSTYALKYNGTELSSNPADAVLSGDFTTELMLGYIAETKDSAVFSLGGESPMVLYSGLGDIFTKNEKGVPTSAITSASGFSLAYGEALKLSGASSDNAIFTLEKLSPLAEGATYLPIPKASRDLEYSSPVDESTLSLFAAPAGVISGKRLVSLINALCEASHDYRELARTEICNGGGEKAREMLDIIEKSAELDLGILLGWGDLYDYLEKGINNSKTADEILADRMTEMRNKAADTAASILADKLGIK